ncbi:MULTISPECIES: methyl-accepting chemotaxis protein [Hungatella]|uniref:Methyl-accepting chemotaxis protein n=1 Tax=Hungatella hathewayi TaxID=154046 RepID=A0AA37JLU8_9FIRM|nr:methyl-accepting chemotaxis protein [Hungatella hathewayi]GKH03950.1 methyl-accepting chemotaxis protein [Hungatella hathewayi]GKH07962.1 methyl-accepting chemotaxis protein [Hungatella hathewayi]
MKNLKVSRKLTISYGFILSLLVISIVVSIGNLISIRSKVEVFYNGPFRVLNAANTVNSSFEAMQKSVFRAISSTSQANTEQALENARAWERKIQEQIPVIQKDFLGDQAIVERLQAALDELAPQREHVLDLAVQNQKAEASAYMEANNIITIHKAQAELDELIEIADRKADELIVNLHAMQTKFITILSVLGIASVLVSVFFGIYITRGITRPIKELEAAARQMEQGHLKIDVNYASKDELGSLSDSMRQMSDKISYYMDAISRVMRQLADSNLEIPHYDDFQGDFLPVQESLLIVLNSLNEIISEINMFSDQVANGADQVSNGAQILSQGVIAQASSVEELAATMSEISQQVKENAETSQVVKTAAGEMGANILACNQQMQEMKNAMEKINQNSTQIRTIIKTIDDIAFQTNILALNAAVEAARAGESGKGFSVVAQEVRSLATRSSDASKSTEALIEQSLAAVVYGTKVAEETAASLRNIAGGTDEMISKINQIAEASKRQAAATEMVSTGIDQISDIVQTNSATAEESAAASEELYGQSQVLKSRVSRFKLHVSRPEY